MGRTDALVLRGLSFFGRHGVLKAERQLGQRFVVDLRVEADLRRAGKSDNLSDSLDYVALYNIAKEEVETPNPRNLVEALAEDIAARVLEEHAAALSVQVTVTKPHVAVPNVDAVGVDIFRARE
jgi:7,8-dihydroneopterin aldolase/epimerase/oxygenase